MNVVLFCHSLFSDWNHGNAHFLRGVVAELQDRQHDVTVYEPRDGWSRANLVTDHGEQAITAAQAVFPNLRSTLYDPLTVDVAPLVEAADLVIVHEWNEPSLVAALGRERVRSGFRLLFHDTHHRLVTQPDEMHRYDLRNFDGVLAFGNVLRDLYLDKGLARRAWTWHEAADTRIFFPRTAAVKGDLVWVGNWGDGERTSELEQFLVRPVARLGLRADVFGVRYERSAIESLEAAGIHYRGWVANHRVPQVFAEHLMTVHVPRRPYVEALPGIPTIRMFEALACGIPLVSAPWHDVEGLFREGLDHLQASDSSAMTALLRKVKNEPELADSLRANGLATIASAHTCAHRVDELLDVCRELGLTVEAHR